MEDGMACVITLEFNNLPLFEGAELMHAIKKLLAAAGKEPYSASVAMDVGPDDRDFEGPGDPDDSWDF